MIKSQLNWGIPPQFQLAFDFSLPPTNLESQKIIYLYYQIRSNYTWKLSDDMLAECMEKTFSIQLGIVDGRYKENLLDMIGRYFK